MSITTWRWLREKPNVQVAIHALKGNPVAYKIKIENGGLVLPNPKTLVSHCLIIGPTTHVNDRGEVVWDNPPGPGITVPFGTTETTLGNTGVTDFSTPPHDFPVSYGFTFKDCKAERTDDEPQADEVQDSEDDQVPPAPTQDD